MTFISIVPYNRELLVIKDMDVFASFFCYAKKQKKGLVPISRPTPAIGSKAGNDPSLFEDADGDGDDDLRPITNLGFRF